MTYSICKELRTKVHKCLIITNPGLKPRVSSAGTHPAPEVNKKAEKEMAEAGIDISHRIRRIHHE